MTTQTSKPTKAQAKVLAALMPSQDLWEQPGRSTPLAAEVSLCYTYLSSEDREALTAYAMADKKITLSSALVLGSILQDCFKVLYFSRVNPSMGTGIHRLIENGTIKIDYFQRGYTFIK